MKTTALLADRLKSPAFKAAHDVALRFGFKHRWDPEHPAAGTTYSTRTSPYLSILPSGEWYWGRVRGTDCADLEDELRAARMKETK